MGAWWMLLGLSAAQPPEAPLVRVVEDRLVQRAAMVQPLGARPIDGRFGVSLGSGLSLGDPGRHGGPGSVTVAAGLSGFSLLLVLPWAVETADPIGGSDLGNVGVGIRATVHEDSELRVGLLIDTWLGSGRAGGARALIFGMDLPRYAPRAYTLSLGAGMMTRLSLLVLGANAGVDGHLHVDPVRDNTKDLSLWAEAWMGLPFPVATESGTEIWLAPVLEANGRSTFTWQGAASDLVLGAGLCLSFGSRSYTAEYDQLHRFAVTAGYQQSALQGGPGSELRPQLGRLMLSFDFGFIADRVLWASARGGG